MEIIISTLPENWRPAKEMREIACGVKSAAVTKLMDSAMTEIAGSAKLGRTSGSVYVKGVNSDVITTAKKILETLGYSAKVDGNYIYVKW